MQTNIEQSIQEPLPEPTAKYAETATRVRKKNRWLLLKEINKGTTQREIARKYNMSLCKITRGSKELQKPDSAFLKMLKMLED